MSKHFRKENAYNLLTQDSSHGWTFHSLFSKAPVQTCTSMSELHCSLLLSLNLFKSRRYRTQLNTALSVAHLDYEAEIHPKQVESEALLQTPCYPSGSNSPIEVNEMSATDFSGIRTWPLPQGLPGSSTGMNLPNVQYSLSFLDYHLIMDNMEMAPLILSQLLLCVYASYTWGYPGRTTSNAEAFFTVSWPFTKRYNWIQTW